MSGVYASPLHRRMLGSVLGCLLGLGSLLGLGGCTPHLPSLPPQPPASLPQGEIGARATYQLAVGDRVRFISWSIPELSCEVLVKADGTVVYPYVGTVQARGRTVVQLKTALETALGQWMAAAGLERLDPHVLGLQADVIDYGRAQVAVLGEVRLPGVYPWQPDATPLTLIAQAGGLTAHAWFVALLIHAAPPQSSATTTPLAPR